eukprot:TRINITY_DN13671_c0_g1_i1.p1 TRINITY_DN13671_c0_g1~~TRINITY_DN13671_c0_g1_i1.p1  ORF type:complete len:230 (-),score=23.20 TRINITY_DN13671_c0_g1_i1:37-726(-)
MQCIFLCLVLVTLSYSFSGWQQLITTGGPLPRYYHVSTICPVDSGYVYIFGGVIYQNGITNVVNDMWRIDISDESNSSSRWESVTSSNTPPPARGYHSGVLTSEGKWFIFGGRNEQTECFNDLWSYDFKLNTWEQLVQNGDKSAPRKRFWHSAASSRTSNTTFYVFGGYGLDTTYPGYGPMNDLWVYNGTWVQLKPNITTSGSLCSRLLFTLEIPPFFFSYDEKFFFSL